MSVNDVCRDVRLFLKGLTQELPDIFPAPRWQRPAARRRAPPRARRLSPTTAAERETAKELILSRVNHWAAALNLRYNRVFVKDQRTLWGSCSVHRNLNFYWRLAAAPVEILDYIVIHELCHLREMNHSKDFWALVRLACPDYKVRRKWLRDNCAAVRSPAASPPFFQGTPIPFAPVKGTTATDNTASPDQADLSPNLQP